MNVLKSRVVQNSRGVVEFRYFATADVDSTSNAFFGHDAQHMSTQKREDFALVITEVDNSFLLRVGRDTSIIEVPVYGCAEAAWLRGGRA